MNQEINDLLRDELEEAHAYFDNTILEIKEKDDNYPSNDVVNVENNSYFIANEALDKMDEALEKYNELVANNGEFFASEREIKIKFIFLYIMSIIIIKVFAKTLSYEKINELWYAMLGVLLGTINTNMLHSNLHQYRYASKENRELMNEIMALREEYDNNFDIANREIQYMFSLNRNLDTEITSEKHYVKTIKGMH